MFWKQRSGPDFSINSIKPSHPSSLGQFMTNIRSRDIFDVGYNNCSTTELLPSPVFHFYRPVSFLALFSHVCVPEKCSCERKLWYVYKTACNSFSGDMRVSSSIVQAKGKVVSYHLTFWLYMYLISSFCALVFYCPLFLRWSDTLFITA